MQNSGTIGRREPPGAEDIRVQLQRVVTSSEFPSFGRGAAFLTYIVEETLAGRATRLKGFSIALEVFRRDEHFTQEDPVVRIEAGRLRRALERYYFVAGQTDPVRIDIPKGGYVPTFKWSTPPPSEAEEEDVVAMPRHGIPRSSPWQAIQTLMVAGLTVVGMLGVAAMSWFSAESSPVGAGLKAMPDEPSLVIAPFANLGESPEARLYTVGLTEELLTTLPRFKEIKVFGRETSKSLTPDVDVAQVREQLGARYLLAGAVRVSGDRMRVSARLVDTGDGAILWSQNYDNDMRSIDLFKVQSDVASRVATAVAQPYGIIAQADTARPPPDDLGAYECTLTFYAYRTELSPESHALVRNCLEAAVARYPGYATAWAMLSMIYLDEDKYKFNRTPGDTTPTERALQTARRAIQIEPANTRGLQALMAALFFDHEPVEAIEIGERALATNPNDTELMGEFGTRLAIAGQWGRGAALLDQAIALNPGGGGFYRGNRALASYMLGETTDAVIGIRQSDMQKFPLFHAVAAIIYAEAGLTADARREGETFVKMRPDFIPNIQAEMSSRGMSPSDLARLIAGLRKAGLKVSDSSEPIAAALPDGT
ncbi:adenylate cyclase [Pararhizobium qamdonense]|uniref:adenylate cyclase n=1 Tax=Pararhizobium qamdonense TaxID=3031126 RepID=UPI0023E14AC6|nr:adenylate cyclase [Pararhizobium qamdonense]